YGIALLSCPATGPTEENNEGTIYVVNTLSEDISVIDGNTNTVITSIGGGSFPQGVGINLLTNRIYVANNNSSNVSMIDGNTNTVIATVGVGVSPVGVGVNPSTNLIYITNSGSDNVSVIDEIQ
ncbi:YncE family protein, partial [Bacillus thuringiensis]|uniref:YncE family protein n=1 Tax=Bacillus thuringiensis TaxID=1428 RepID=UPI0021001AD4